MFLLRNIIFCMYCRQSGVFDVHLLYISDYSCNLFLYVELIIHACEKVIQGIMVSEEYPYCLAFIVIMVR